MKRNTPRRRGLTLAETLLSLTITAALMVAMGGAFTAAGSAVQMNDTYFRSVHQSRCAIDMIMTQVRRCAAVTSPPPSSQNNATSTVTSITLTPATSDASDSSDFSGHNITIAYNSSGTYAGDITLYDNTTGTYSVLAQNVTSAAFTALTGKSFSGTLCVAAISLTMTVQIGENQITLSNSAAPRVNAVSLYQ
jgi:hypothetical protein